MLIQNHMAINLGKWDNFHISSETLWRLIRLKHCKWVSATNSRRLCIKGAQLSDLLSSHLVSIQVMRFYRGSVERTGVRAASATHFSLGAKFNSRNGKDKFCWSWIEIHIRTSRNSLPTSWVTNSLYFFLPVSRHIHSMSLEHTIADGPPTSQHSTTTRAAQHCAHCNAALPALQPKNCFSQRLTPPQLRQRYSTLYLCCETSRQKPKAETLGLVCFLL